MRLWQDVLDLLGCRGVLRVRGILAVIMTRRSLVSMSSKAGSVLDWQQGWKARQRAMPRLAP